MLFNDCGKAVLYNNYEELFGEAKVSVDVNGVIVLTFPEPCSEELRSEMKVIFYDGAKGLTACLCRLSGYEEYISPQAKRRESRVVCTIDEVLSTTDRRSDIKALISTEIQMKSLDDEGNELVFLGKFQDISAGGLCFSSSQALNKGQVIHFSLTPATKELQLSAEILRQQEDGTYGARFIHLSAANESELRGYVFRLDLERKKGED